MTTIPTWQLEAIAAESAGLAQVAEGHLTENVRTCPGWTVADLVRHLAQVQWFWATIVEERLVAPPPPERRPAPPSDEDAIATLRHETAHLLRALTDVDGSTAVWTWSSQRDVAFVARHQVHEATVHHFDGADVAGVTVEVDPRRAGDGVDEFLTFLLSTADDPKDDDVPGLSHAFTLHATDTGSTWSVEPVAGTNHLLVARRVAVTPPTVAAPATELLWWLYGRCELPGLDPELVAAFRALCWTS